MLTIVSRFIFLNVAVIMFDISMFHLKQIPFSSSWEEFGSLLLESGRSLLLQGKVGYCNNCVFTRNNLGWDSTSFNF